MAKFTFHGTSANDIIKVSANGQHIVLTDDFGNVLTDVIGVDNLLIDGKSGDDTIDASALPAGLTQLTIDGGSGNDTIIGSQGADLLIGGSGDDVVIGGRGNDVAQLGSGDDLCVWNPGDGSDTVDGQSGFDTLLFNGANVNENINISANGSHALFTRDVASITMDLTGVERIDFNALGGADSIFVNDLSGTDVTEVDINLAGTLNGSAGDGAADTVIVNGSAGKDNVSIAGNGASVAVTGLSAQVTIDGAEAANDSLLVNGLGGNDTIDASSLNSGQIRLTIDGGAGNDTIIGSQGADTLFGGDGNDVITGGRGDDVALLGFGDDTFIWNPGDGSDTVEGQDGVDTLLFNGANISENVDISANGSRVLFTRDIANISMDLDGVEHIQFNALSGADNVTVNDLTGTDVAQVAIDLAGITGGKTGDGQTDTVTVNGTTGSDNITLENSGDEITVSGLAAQVTIDHADKGDLLVVNGLGGDDVIDASNLAAGHINLALNGGTGNDVLIGSHGNDTVFGGTGSDVALLGDGDDTFVWNPGDGSDTVEGQAGSDTLLFNGANIGEKIDISANGSRALFTRDVANITMDLNGVEAIDFNALGGADNIVVNDLSGTDVKHVAIDLAGTLGGSAGDGADDTVTVNGTAGNDHISVADSGTAVVVSGLAAQVTVDGAEAANDAVVVNGVGGTDTLEFDGSGVGETISILANGQSVAILQNNVLMEVNGVDNVVIDGNGGDDVIAAGNGLSTLTNLTIDGGAGNDTITGGDGNDTLIGGDGNDVVTGGKGADVALLGSGDDRFIWNPGDGSDTVDGGSGFDTLDFRGANVSEKVDISANGSHATFFRDVANITMDLDNVERIQFKALGGADNIVVNDLKGTDVKQVDIDLASSLGGTGDGAADTVTVNGTGGNDQIDVTASGTLVTVSGLPAQVTIDHAEGGDLGDHLVINGGAGNDTINASALPAGTIGLTLDGGAGNNTFVFTFGTNGNDVIQGFQAHGAGGQGDLVALMGASDHTFNQAVADGHIAQSGADVVISDGTNVAATLQNIMLTSLHANDFHFG
jgi:Ca2+-binding RTX toxin-like protein